MKIDIIYKKYEDDDSEAIIKINDKQIIRIDDDATEDKTLLKDLKFIFNIPDLMKLAYDAGVAGEEFEIVKTESKIVK